MKTNFRPHVCLLFTLAFVLLCAALASSCKGSGAVTDLHAGWVKADRAVYDQVAPRFLEYLSADPDLAPETKEQLELLVDDWLFRIKTAETKLGDDPVGMTEDEARARLRAIKRAADALPGEGIDSVTDVLVVQSLSDAANAACR